MTDRKLLTILVTITVLTLTSIANLAKNLPECAKIQHHAQTRAVPNIQIFDRWFEYSNFPYWGFHHYPPIILSSTFASPFYW